MSSQEFRELIRVFTAAVDPFEHQQAIIAMLDPLDLDIEYKKLSREGGIDRVQSIFSSFADVHDDEMLSDYERKRLEQVGTLTDLYFSQKSYSSFALMIYQLLLESVLEKYDFGIAGTTQLKSDMLYATLPEEIQLQTFLLESMANSKVFNWNREDDIVVQSLLLLTVCFGDVYSFLTEDEEDDGEFFED